MTDQEPQDSTNNVIFVPYLCTQDPQLMDIYFVYITPALCVLSAIVVFIFTVFFISAYMKKKLNLSGYMFSITLLFFIIIFLCFASRPIQTMNFCGNQSIYSLFVRFPVSLFLNVLKAILLVGILFTNVDTVFNGTPFALSRCTIISFRVLYTLPCILIICGGIMFSLNRRMPGFAASVISELLLDILSIYLVCVFIRKLLQTYRSLSKHCQSPIYAGDDENNTKQLVSVITKIALLFTISTCTRIAVLVVQAGLMVVLNAHYKLFSNLFLIVDWYANFFCIFLCFKCFDAVYMKLCGICDRFCHRCWMRCVGGTVDEMMMKDLQIIRIQSKSSHNATSISCDHGATIDGEHVQRSPDSQPQSN